jgi:hypothetical protein
VRQQNELRDVGLGAEGITRSRVDAHERALALDGSEDKAHRGGSFVDTPPRMSVDANAARAASTPTVTTAATPAMIAGTRNGISRLLLARIALQCRYFAGKGLRHG